MATAQSPGSSPSQSTIEADFAQSAGQIRPLHGMNCGPISEGFTRNLSGYFRELKIPCVRIIAPNFPAMDCANLQEVFPDFKADPAGPAN
jgi:xylan 1,4-beta-xylosidase